MGEYSVYLNKKTNRRTGRVSELNSVRSLLEQWSNRKRTQASIIYFKGYLVEGNHTSAEFCMETLHNTYHVFFPNIFEAIHFLLKHKMCTVQNLLEGTDAKLRKIVMDEIEKYEISRIERKVRYNRTRDS